MSDAIEIVISRKNVQILETTPRYDVLLFGVVVDQLYFNMKGYRGYLPAPLEKPPAKGEKRGECNRTACNLPNAIWYNSSTRMYYCTACAHKINNAHPDNKGLCTLTNAPGRVPFANVDIGEKSISAFRKEAAKLNKEWAEWKVINSVLASAS